MTVAVVVGLEAVEVDEDERGAAAVAAKARSSAAQRLGEVVVVAKARQAVGEGPRRSSAGRGLAIEELVPQCRCEREPDPRRKADRSTRMAAPITRPPTSRPRARPGRPRPPGSRAVPRPARTRRPRTPRLATAMAGRLRWRSIGRSTAGRYLSAPDRPLRGGTRAISRERRTFNAEKALARPELSRLRVGSSSSGVGSSRTSALLDVKSDGHRCARGVDRRTPLELPGVGVEIRLAPLQGGTELGQAALLGLELGFLRPQRGVQLLDRLAAAAPRRPFRPPPPRWRRERPRPGRCARPTPPLGARPSAAAELPARGRQRPRRPPGRRAGPQLGLDSVGAHRRAGRRPPRAP